ncbi:MAG: hypothetical protein IKQ91_03295 [Oscillospiraceae bacterium]|nr:hypothetical protein [Oscillospiraceae bacterium]
MQAKMMLKDLEKAGKTGSDSYTKMHDALENLSNFGTDKFIFNISADGESSCVRFFLRLCSGTVTLSSAVFADRYP